jgi:hypothetical protein
LLVGLAVDVVDGVVLQLVRRKERNLWIFYQKKLFLKFFFWSATPCASPPPRPSIFSNYSFRVHYHDNRDDRQILAHAMASDFLVTWQCLSKRTIGSKKLLIKYPFSALSQTQAFLDPSSNVTLVTLPSRCLFPAPATVAHLLSGPGERDADGGRLVNFRPVVDAAAGQDDGNVVAHFFLLFVMPCET